MSDPVTIHCGDSAAILAGMATDSIDCAITSPPYFNLRGSTDPRQIGSERTMEEYVERLVGVFREVRRVVRGVLWLNLGDTYAATGGPQIDGTKQVRGSQHGAWRGESRRPPPGVKAKDMLGIPWQVAFALRGDGWYLRQECIWHKPNSMPSKVKDRPTRSHEHLFMLAKGPTYYYDWEAVKEPSRNGTGRNLRSVWDIPTAPGYGGGHRSTFPVGLVLPCIRASSPPGGTVLDPFAGTGTVGAAALELGREAILIELLPEYCAMARERLGLT